MRTVESYERDLLRKNPELTGIKGPCIFNELKSFHLAENTYLDIMHDTDEGCWKYLMYNVIKYLYDQGRFSVNYLNEIIQKFFYGCEGENRLSSMSKDDLCKAKRLRLSASETRCLVRYFGLMVGHLIQDEDKEV